MMTIADRSALGPAYAAGSARKFRRKPEIEGVFQRAPKCNRPIGGGPAVKNDGLAPGFRQFSPCICRYRKSVGPAVNVTEELKCASRKKYCRRRAPR